MRWIVTIIVLAVLVIGLATSVFIVATKPAPPSPARAPATAAIARAIPGTMPATTAATGPSSLSPRVQTYTDLLHTLPGLADATLVEERLTIPQAAVIHLPFHAYICPRHDLWIAHREAPSIVSVEQDQFIKQTTHVTREKVVYAHWQRIGRDLHCTPVIRDELGAYRVILPRSPRGASGPTGPTGPTVKLERFDYHWLRAINMGESIVVPTDQGVAVIRITAGAGGKEVTQQYRPISEDEKATPQVAITGKGFLAWLPPAFMTPTSTVLRYVDGAFVDNFAQGSWAGPFIHLVPFTDGNILQIAPADVPGKVRLAIVPLESEPAAAADVRKLIAQLSDDDSEVRVAAHAQLAAMGPSAWAVIEKAIPSLPLEARARAQQIIAARTEPRLGRFQLVDSALRPIWRLGDGGVVMLAEQGVLTMRDDPNEVPVVPAWVAIRPGMTISLLPPALTRYLTIGTLELDAIGSDWVITDETEGARIFFGQELQSITREADRKYRHVVGVDNDGRILLATAPAQVAAKAIVADYLLIDPRVADPTPVLPVWTMTVPQGETGWDKNNWPAVKRGQPWSLHEDGWEGLTGEIIKSVGTANTITQDQQTLTELATDPRPRGATFFSNRATLALRTPDGKVILKARPAGMPNIDLAGAFFGDQLYLLHPQGKLTRLKVDMRAIEPFSVDAIFTSNIPSAAQVNRMWVDPAGRICIAADEDRIIIIFTGRKIPQAIRDIIPENELKQARP